MIQILGLFAFLMATVALSVGYNANDTKYAEAVLDFQKEKFLEAIEKLNEVIVAEPGRIEAWELKALSLKQSGQLDESVRVYEKLLNASKKQGRTPEQIAPYEFELGVLHQQLRQNAEAKLYLGNAIRREFNVPAAKYFLGVIAFEEEDYKNAQTYFESVIRSETKELKSISMYYLGMIASKQGEAKQADRRFQISRNYASRLMSQPSTSDNVKAIHQQLVQTLDAALGQSSTSQIFSATFATLSGYDSNNLLYPTAGLNTAGTSMQLQ